MFFLFNQFQMKNQNNPLAIILTKVPNGYKFEQLRQLPNTNTGKHKKGKPPTKSNPKNRVPNRLIKQIGLSNQQIQAQILDNPHTKQPSMPQPPTPALDDQPQSNMPIISQIAEQQEVSCEIERQDLQQSFKLPESPAKWFDKQTIHQIQKAALKNIVLWEDKTNTEEGQSTKTLMSENVYLKYRNFIYDAYQKNPKRYLTKISCRSILRGDVNKIHKIHNFLQRQGLINYGIGMDGNYSFKAKPLAKTYEHRNKPQSCLKSLPQNDQQTTEKQIDTDNMTLTVINKNFSRTFRTHCHICKLICGIVWYANVSQDQTNQKNVCYDCYNGKLSNQQRQEYEKVDIIKKMESNSTKEKGAIKVSWNIEDNLKLLDFMSHNQDKSWADLINQFNGKKTIEDIILQYMQFPISNFQPEKTKKSNLKRFINKEVEQTDIGYNEQDYETILKNFFQQSEYFNRKSDRKQILCQDYKMNGVHINSKHKQSQQEQMQENSKVQQFEQSNLQKLIISMNQQMATKIQYLMNEQKMLQTVTLALDKQLYQAKKNTFYEQVQKNQQFSQRNEKEQTSQQNGILAEPIL